ncbi:MAG: hypothetical protein ACREBO_14365 [Novosphingobium sp.]
MRYVVAGALAACLLAGTAALADEPVTLAVPDEPGWGPLRLVLVDHDRAYPDGDFYCPPDPDEQSICLGADYVRGPVRIARYLSPGSPDWRFPGRKPIVRFIGGHAVRFVDAGLKVELLEQTDSGYLWRVWAGEVERGWVCFPDNLIERFKLQPARGWTARGEEQNCLRLKNIE